MTLTEEQAKQIKEKLLEQLSNFPQDKKEQITQQVNTMTPNQLEDFVKQNQLNHLGGQCIFCSIVSGETQALRIAENENNIAILEINPLSKGHTLVVPREHSTKIESSAQELAKEVKEKLQEKFNPNKIELKEIKVMEHPLIEVIPIYGTETGKKQATEEELKMLQEEILKKPEPQEEKEEAILEIPEKLFKMPPRIPR
ncbi:HIT domain-containing protein [Candidatus Pacearchaeota archaeon]|nr:HIT domain-containing protein [Candidatus Pacearchaeota archaeon]